MSDVLDRFLRYVRIDTMADFEKLAQGGRILSVSTEEVAEIERSLIREINKALASPSKT
jgi:hypothetical protein